MNIKNVSFIILLIAFQFARDKDSGRLTGIPEQPDEPELEVLNYYPYIFDPFEFPKDSMIIANIGTGNLEWSYSTNVPWLHFFPSYGINDDTIIFDINWNYFQTQGTSAGIIRLFTSVDSIKWHVHAENINSDIQISLSYTYALELPDSNDLSGYECYASFNRKVERLETYYQSSSVYLYDFELSVEEQDTLLAVFNDVDFLNLMNGIPNPLLGINYPCSHSTIRYRSDIYKEFKTVYVNHGQSSNKYPPGFLEFYNTISRILKGLN